MELWTVQPLTFRQLGKRTRTGGINERILAGKPTRLALDSLCRSVLGSILVLAAVQHNAASAFVLLVFYGLGAGLPLLLIAYGGRYLSRHLLNLRSYSAVLQRIGGGIVVVTAIAILLGWDVQIQLWLAPIFPALPL